MKTIKVFAALVAAFISTSMFGQVIKGSDVTISQGKTAEVTFSIEGTEKGSLAEFDLTLPEGITISYDTDEEDYVYSLESEMTLKSHSATVRKKENGSFYVLVSNASGKEFKAASGKYLTLTLEASATAAIGETVANMKKIGLFNLTTKQMNTVTEDTFKITVADPSGIESITVDDIKDAKVYTIDGQRVDNITKKGVYIVNGKKMVIK